MASKTVFEVTYKHLVLGGARSGKSRYAEKCAQSRQLKTDQSLAYVATATADDSEMTQRIKQHQARRNANWLLIEEPIYLSGALAQAPRKAVILIDCLTLWLSNCLHQNLWYEQRSAFLNTVANTEQELIIVSNEVGSGIVPMGELSREFVDQSGWLHQELAEHCTKVDLVVAGLPLALMEQDS